MKKHKNQSLTDNSQSLRKNMTKEERKLWYQFLKSLPVTIKRQHVVGSYIVDFYIASSKLVIELDGSQHYDDEGRQSDKLRDDFLKSLGLSVLRYSNLDVNTNFDGVCQDISAHLR